MTLLSDLLKPALRIAGITTLPGTTPSIDQFGELIPACNRMMGSFNLDGHKIFTTRIDVYPLVRGKKTYTIGPGGDFDGPRPLWIKDANFLFPGNPTIRRHIHIADDHEWSRIVLQDIPGSLPYILYYDFAFNAGLGGIYLKGQPTDGYSLELFTWQQLPSGFVATTDVVILPDGYEELIVTNLALVAASLYPREAMLSPLAPQNAARALSAVRTMNSRSPKMRSEAAHLGGSRRVFGGATALIGGAGGITDVIWIDPIIAPDGLRSTFTFRNTPVWASFNGVNQFLGVGYNVVGYRTLQFIDVNGLTIVPGPTDSVKAAISSGSTTPAGPPGLTESYIAVTGTINGTNGSDGNAIFTLATIPAVLKLYRNGLLVDPTHYTLNGTTLTFLIPYIPVTGDTLLAEGTF